MGTIPVAIPTNTHAWSMSSNVWMVFLDWSSVWGWKAISKYKVVPRAFCSFGQNRDVNRRSRSDTIDIGIPWRLTILLMYNLANLFKEKVLQMARKCTDLVSWSTITQMASWPIWVWGKSTTKSMVMCFHFHSSIGKGWRVSTDFWCFTSPIGTRDIWTQILLCLFSYQTTNNFSW